MTFNLTTYSSPAMSWKIDHTKNWRTTNLATAATVAAVAAATAVAVAAGGEDCDRNMHGLSIG